MLRWKLFLRLLPVFKGKRPSILYHVSYLRLVHFRCLRVPPCTSPSLHQHRICLIDTLCRKGHQSRRVRDNKGRSKVIPQMVGKEGFYRKRRDELVFTKDNKHWDLGHVIFRVTYYERCIIYWLFITDNKKNNWKY